MTENRISTLDWPGNSPDLNPIENLWHIMGSKINSIKPTSSAALIKLIEKVWYEEIPTEHLQQLVNSMPRRIAMVIKNRGGTTKY